MRAKEGRGEGIRAGRYAKGQKEEEGVGVCARGGLQRTRDMGNQTTQTGREIRRCQKGREARKRKVYDGPEQREDKKPDLEIECSIMDK